MYVCMYYTETERDTYQFDNKYNRFGTAKTNIQVCFYI